MKLNKKIIIVLVILMILSATLYTLNQNGFFQKSDVKLTIKNALDDMSYTELNLWRSTGVYSALEIESRFKSDENLDIIAYEYKSGKLINELYIATMYKDNKNAYVAFYLDKERGYKFVGGNGVHYDSDWFSPYTQSSYGMDLSSNTISVNKGEELLIGYFVSSVENGLKMYNVQFGVDIETAVNRYLDDDMVILITAKVE